MGAQGKAAPVAAGARRHRGARALLAAALAAALGLAGCSQSTSGSPVSIYADPFRVAGLPASSGPSGPRPGAPPPTISAEGATDSAADTLALDALSDIQAFWISEYQVVFGAPLQPVEQFYSWNPDERSGEFCEGPTFGLVNAGYCPLDHSIGWDREVMVPEVSAKFGDLAAVAILAHEYGHAVQQTAGIVSEDVFSLVPEQQADCFAGSFIRHVAEGDAQRFTIGTGQGLNGVLAAVVAVRDRNPNDPASIHGSAFERVTAFQIGFTDGSTACARIDEAEIESRRGGLPQMFADEDDTGELPITQSSIDLAVASLEAQFDLAAPPAVLLEGADLGCVDARPSPPVSYCPSSNTIGIDLAGLRDLGEPSEPTDGFEVRVSGDFSAYSLLASRFTLAAQRERGASLVGARTALRAACLTGAWTATIAAGEVGAGFVLSPGDLDEAVSELLVSGTVASDANGSTVPSGFARVDAFRTGVLQGDQTCHGRYR
jgi:predicted metalloprotease